MTTAEAIDKFAVLIDKYGSPNFSDDETLQFLNTAQLERLKRLIPDDQGGVVNFEFDENTLFNVRPLIYAVSTSMTSGGVVTFSTLTTALRTASGDSTCNLHRIMDIGWTVSSVTYPVHYTKHNNWNAFKRNTFKVGSSTAPRYKADATNITFDPISTSASLTFNLMKTPKIMTAVNTPDWDDSNMNLIIEIALQYAAQSIRDPELLGAIQNSNVSK
jgi:hypothetical protein